MKKDGFVIIAGILCTAVFCFIINGLHLDDEFEMTLAEPSPSAYVDYSGAVDSSGKININTAGIKELDTLEGIGEKMARRIITYREQNGSFKQIEDIMKVQGIGKKTFEKLKDSICVSCE